MITALKVNGMSCQNCARHVREALTKVDGVSTVDIDLDAGKAVVRWKAEENIPPLIEALKKAGFPGSVIGHEKKGAGTAGSGWHLNVIIGSICTLPLMIGDWGFHLHGHGWFGWLGLFLASPVQVIAGWRFYKGAWEQLKAGQSNMDTLVSLGSTAAFGLSVYGLITGAHHLYFMEACAIITLISVGHYLEARVAVKAAAAVSSLLKLAPETAQRLKPDGTVEMVPLEDVAAGDQLVVRPGDRVPTDGVVEQGNGTVDESMLTGESLPVEKTAGTILYAGTVNYDGRLLMKVTATGETTALARIIRIVERAQTSRAGIERLADRVSSVFVPIVIVIAIGTALGWGLAGMSWTAGIINAIGVLIVACPCAMGLATPAAIMAGANTAAKRGILIRDGVALEKCGKITAVLFDKTGTLTVGKPEVLRVLDIDDQAAITGPLARALSEPSKHPFSRAVSDYFKTVEPVKLEDWREQPGSGVSAEFDGRTARLGSLRWLQENGIAVEAIPPGLEGTVIGLALGTRLIGAMLVVDSTKPHAKEVVAQIIRLGFDVYLVSGDAKRTVETLGREIGIPAGNIYSEIQPGAKAGIVQALQEAGSKVAFVGDGINDAPALARADLGIAVTCASDVAADAADILLLKSDIEGVPEALGLSAATLRTIKQNLFWAFFYNMTTIPLAAAGFMSPVFCAAAMALSDLFVIGNALRLLRWK